MTGILDELYVLHARGKLARIILAETVLISVISFFLFGGKDSVTYASAYDFSIMINDHTSVLSTIIMILLPLFGSFTIGDVFSAEEGIRSYLLARKGKGRYISGKICVLLMVSFLNTLFMFELFTFYESVSIRLTGNLYIPENFSQIISYCLENYNPQMLDHPVFFTHLFFMLMSLFASGCGLLSAGIGLYFTNPVFSYISGFVAATGVSLINWKYSYFGLFSNFVENLAFSSHLMALSGILIWFAVMALGGVILIVLKMREQ
ncbi:MAG: hypothetical protein IJM15_03865 [Erysipelotrichaceae bacterium]|nr:hypothetical protein [Erysipelotrichaceae bacterium]